jgi:shikimate kinase
LPGVMRDAGADVVAVSGAGPAHYAMVSDLDEAHRIAANVRGRLGDWAQVDVASPVAARSKNTGIRGSAV